MRFLLPISIFLLIGCSSSKKEFASVEEFEAYLNDSGNGYIQSDEVGDLLFEAKLNPFRRPQSTICYSFTNQQTGWKIRFGNQHFL
jgi:hypothetical protein